MDSRDRERESKKFLAKVCIMRCARQPPPAAMNQRVLGRALEFKGRSLAVFESPSLCTRAAAVPALFEKSPSYRHLDVYTLFLFPPTDPHIYTYIWLL